MGLDLAFFAAPDDERALEAERRPGGPLGWPEVTGSRRSGLLRREPVVTELGPADGVGTRGYDPVLTTGTLEALLTGRDVEAVLQDPRSGGAPGGGDEVLEDEHLEFLRRCATSPGARTTPATGSPAGSRREPRTRAVSSGASPSFEGVSLDEVLAGGTGLYEVTTSSGVPVRMHDMRLVALVHDPLRRTLVVELLYDDPRWTPEAARLTPLAVLAFDGVEVVEHREEPAGPGATADDLGRVMGFDHDPASGVFALSAFTTYLVFTASRVVLGLRPARTPPAGPPDPRS